MITQKYIDSLINMVHAECEMIKANAPADEVYLWQWSHISLTKREDGGYEYSVVYGSEHDKPTYFGDKDVYMELARYHSGDKVFVVFPEERSQLYYLSSKSDQVTLPRIAQASFLNQEPECDLRDNPNEILSSKPVGVMINLDDCNIFVNNIPVEWVFSDMQSALQYSARVLEAEVAELENTLSLRKQELARTHNSISNYSSDKHCATKSEDRA